MKRSNRYAAFGAMLAASSALLIATLPSVDSDKAYLWVDTDGGTCTVNDPPATYVDGAACGTLQAAYEASEPGWLNRIKSGTYPPQQAGSREKFAPVKFIAEANTKIDTTTSHNQGLSLLGNILVDGVDVDGDTPLVFLGGRRSTWQNATFMEGATGDNARSCEHNDAEPINIYAAETDQTIQQATLRNIVIEQQHYRPAEDDTCGGGDGYHLELLRIDNNVDGVLIDGVFFSECDSCGSGLMFVTTPNPTIPGPQNLVVRNSIFEMAPSYSFQMNSNNDDCHGYIFAYNTFSQDNAIGCDTLADIRWVGNLGPKPLASPCKGTYERNVWQRESFGFEWFKCGTTDTIIEGTNFGIDALGIGADWKLEADSPAIDLGETPSDRDYCTGPLAAEDFWRDPRPVGPSCDAGANEYQG